jgi:cytochrome c-type protein NapB
MAAAFAVGAAFLGLPALAQDSGVTSLRGPIELDETPDVPDIKKASTERRFSRAYRQQPPLIPHKVDKYQINLKVNQCLRCHDWPYNVDEGAPKISETHYFSRQGAALDKVASTRWFCNQCHVPQVRARALVPNTFRSAFED